MNERTFFNKLKAVALKTKFKKVKGRLPEEGYQIRQCKTQYCPILAVANETRPIICTPWTNYYFKQFAKELGLDLALAKEIVAAADGLKEEVILKKGHGLKRIKMLRRKLKKACQLL